MLQMIWKSVLVVIGFDERMENKPNSIHLAIYQLNLTLRSTMSVFSVLTGLEKLATSYR